ncbi:MAG: hypothetical protein ACPGVG_14910 [Mycobacterium sp.]
MLIWFAALLAATPARAVVVDDADWIVVTPGEVEVTGGVEIAEGVYAPTRRGGALEVEALVPLALINVASVAHDPEQPDRVIRHAVLGREVASARIVRRGQWEVWIEGADEPYSSHNRMDTAAGVLFGLIAQGHDARVEAPERFEAVIQWRTIMRYIEPADVPVLPEDEGVVD